MQRPIRPHAPILPAVLVLAMAACAADGSQMATGEYQIMWTLTRAQTPGGTTCSDLEVDHITATITDLATNDTVTEMVPCDQGSLVTEPLPLGDHSISLDAFGVGGERATTFPGQTHGTLAMNGQTLTLPPQMLAIGDPTTRLHSTWNLTYRGAPSSCAELQPNGVAIVVESEGSPPTRDIWDCTEPNATIEVPLAKFSAHAELLGAGDTVVATSSTASFDATRGDVNAVFNLDWP